MAEAYVAQMPRSPFQMRPIENPFNRAVSAVENFRNQVTDRVRIVGNNLTHRTQRSQTQDATQLERARAVVAQEANAQTRPADRKHELAHAVAKTAKEIAINSGPSMAVGMGVRVVLGHALGLQALAVAAGASAASRGVRETVRTVRFGGTYAETTAHILRHSRDRAQEMRSENVNANSSFGGIRQAQERFGNTGVGRVVNGLLHGGERRIAEFAYGRRRHVHALERYRNVDLTTLNERQLLRLREHAIMARITNGTVADVYENRQLARSMYQIATRELADRKISGRALHDKQKRLYRRDARIGAFINIPGQAGLAALKAIPKTFATFFITDALLKAIHVDTSARQSPLEGFENTRLGQLIGNAIAPKSIASAEELTASAPKVAQSAVAEVKATAATAHGESAHNWTQGLAGTRPASPLESSHVAVTSSIEDGRIINSGSGVLSSEKITAVKPVEIPRPPSLAPVVVEVDDKNANAVARAVVSGKDHVVTTQKTVAEVVHEQIAGKTSLTKDIFDKKLIPSMESAPDAVTWYRQAGTAKEMMEHIIMPNSTKLTPEHLNQLKVYLSEHPDASFGALWQENRNVFSADMDKWSMGTGYDVLTEHVVTQQEAQQVALAEAKNARVELADHAGRGKTPGLAKLVAKSATHSPHADTTVPPVKRMPNEDYMAMRKALESGQTVRSVGASTGATTNTSRPTAEEYLAMTRHNSNATSALPANTGNPAHVNTSVEEYKRLIAQTKQASANTGEAVNHSTSVQHPRMDNNVYMRMQSEAASKAAEAARRSQQMDPQEYMKKVAEINARNGGGASVHATPVPHWEAPQVTHTEASIVGPLDLRTAPDQTITMSSDHPEIFQTVSMPIHQVKDHWTQIDTPNFGEGTWFYDPEQGGLVFIWHSGSTIKEGPQFGEQLRAFIQGGGFNGEPRLGPVQEEYRIKMLENMQAHLFIQDNSGKQIPLLLSNVEHAFVDPNNPELILNQPANLIGGNINTVTGRICSWGHVEAIKKLISFASENKQTIPEEYQAYLNVLLDEKATGTQVEDAVYALATYLKNSKTGFDFDAFHRLFGAFGDEVLTADQLAATGYMESGNILMDLVVSGQ